MDRIVEVSTINEEFEKARVKAHIRTRKGKLERVREFERKGGREAGWVGYKINVEGGELAEPKSFVPKPGDAKREHYPLPSGKALKLKDLKVGDTVEAKLGKQTFRGKVAGHRVGFSDTQGIKVPQVKINFGSDSDMGNSWIEEDEIKHFKMKKVGEAKEFERKGEKRRVGKIRVDEKGD